PDEQALFGDATPEATALRIGKAGVAEIVVKDGAEPAYLKTEGFDLRIPAVATTAVDTTGAGDSFNGSYLAARLMGEPPDRAVERAHRVAASVVAVRGALAPHGTMKQAFGD